MLIRWRKALSGFLFPTPRVRSNRMPHTKGNETGNDDDDQPRVNGDTYFHGLTFLRFLILYP